MANGGLCPRPATGGVLRAGRDGRTLARYVVERGHVSPRTDFDVCYPNLLRACLAAGTLLHAFGANVLGDRMRLGVTSAEGGEIISAQLTPLCFIRRVLILL